MSVEDDGKGMTEEMVKQVTDPFVTSRTTGKVGLGNSVAQRSCGSLQWIAFDQIKSGCRNYGIVDFQRSHIDRMPLGDLSTTFLNLLIAHPTIHYIFRYVVGLKNFSWMMIQLKVNYRASH